MGRTILLTLVAAVAVVLLASKINEANAVQLLAGSILLVAIVGLIMASSFSGDGGEDDATDPRRGKRAGRDPDDPFTGL